MLYLKVLHDMVSQNYSINFQKQPEYPRNICTESWRKLPDLTAFLEIFIYLKNNDYVEHMKNVLLVIKSYKKVIKSFHTASCHSDCFELLFLFSSAILLLKWNRYFTACENLPNSSCHFSKHKSVSLQILHQYSVPSNIAPLYLFLARTRYTLVKSSPLKCKCLRFLRPQVKFCQIPHVKLELIIQFLLKFCIILHCHDT